MKIAIPLSMLPVDEIESLAIAADEIGYNFLAVSDHLIHPERFSVRYPYTEDGNVRWESGTDWPDLFATEPKDLHRSLGNWSVCSFPLRILDTRRSACFTDSAVSSITWLD